MSTTEALARIEKMMSRKQIRSIHLALSARYVVSLWVGAVSAGKTFASLVAFLLAIVAAPEGRILIVGRTLRTIEGNVLSELMDRAKFGILVDQIEHTRGASTATILGRVVELVGAPTVLAEGNIRGSTIVLAYVDEVTLLPPDFWRMLMTRLRAEGSKCLATTNPASKNHWLRVEFILKARLWDMAVFKFTMLDNPSLSPLYVLRMARSFTGMFYQRFILGLWTNAAGAIYDGWDHDRHVIRWEDCPPLDRVLAVGIDYGASHATSAIILGVTAEYDARGNPFPRLVLLDEWRHVNDPTAGSLSMAPSRMASEIRLWLNKNHHPLNERHRMRHIYCDPSAKGFRLELSGVGVATIAADNDVNAGISDVSSLLALDRLIVTDRCEGFLSEVTEYVWNAKKTAEGLDEPVKEKDDSVDAARYAIYSTRDVWGAIFRRAYGLAA